MTNLFFKVVPKRLYFDKTIYNEETAEDERVKSNELYGLLVYELIKN